MLRLWCDVGGTFTDAIADLTVAGSPVRRRTKVLSSAVTHSVVSAWTDEVSCRLDAASPAEDFWRTAVARFYDASGSRVCECEVESNTADGRFRFVEPIAAAIEADARGVDLVPRVGAPVLAAHLLAGVPLDRPLPPPVDVRLGTTRGTNALLTRTGARTALLTTAPFGDILRIGHQDRPHLFDLNVRKRPPLAEAVVEVDERVLADGSVERPLDAEGFLERLMQLRARGVESVAVCLLNAYANPEHELAAGSLAAAAGFDSISLSHQVSPIAKWVDRTETTIVDAYLGPKVRAYLAALHEQFGGDARARLRVMTSAGGLIDHAAYRGKDSVLSGPAGGVVALSRLSHSLGGADGPAQLIGLDMGGTSTDVARVQGEPALEFESVKAGVRLLTESLDIQTIAAGGGSICSWDGVQWQVGPQSSGADPGPACYGRGGPLTVTDLNLLTDRLAPDALPFAVDRGAAEAAARKLCREAGLDDSPEGAVALAEGLRRIANEQMAAAVRSITVARGVDPRLHTLVGFGGAAGQHICQIAELIGIDTVIDPPDAGVLSAMGMGLAAVSRTAGRPVYQVWDDIDEPSIDRDFERLETELGGLLVADGIDLPDVRFERLAEVRYFGTEHPLVVPWRTARSALEAFREARIKRFDYLSRGAVELVTLRVKASAASRAIWATPSTEEAVRAVGDEYGGEDLPGPQPRPHGWREHALFHGGQWLKGWRVSRDRLRPGQVFDGPCLITSDSHTTVVEAHRRAAVCRDGSLLIVRLIQSYIQSAVASENALVRAVGSGDAASRQVFREVLARRFAAIATEMGANLERTARSVNVRDRRDFSCAVFDRGGRLIANAPHVPVHLGAMQTTVQHALRVIADMAPGDSYITNDPYSGGSHLPDVTVITPVFHGDEATPSFFVANRAHHAEIGGISPGSMTSAARKLSDEGVVIPLQKLFDRGEDRSGEIERLLAESPHPSRQVDQNMLDLQAQWAANRYGVDEVGELVHEFGPAAVDASLEDIYAATEAKVRRWIAGFPTRDCSFTDYLDDGTPIAVRLLFEGDTLLVDFAGTGPIAANNYNAGLGIVNAAALYVVACMIEDDLPLNAGAMRPIELRVPPGILNPVPEGDGVDRMPAVGAGNVETSQRVVDVLLGALGVCGASQGTMNNVLLGNRRFGFYETVGGGGGATAGCDGESAVHTHMTNTRLTDPEVLERRYPLRLRRLEVRGGSGGAGRHRGGDGMVRELEFLEELDVSLITSRRTPYAPYGAAGGGPGRSGENFHVDRDGVERPLPGNAQLRVAPGERLRVETPGGGGYGKP